MTNPSSPASPSTQGARPHVELFDRIVPSAFGVNLDEVFDKLHKNQGELSEEQKVQVDSWLQKLGEFDEGADQNERDPKKLWDTVLGQEGGNSSDADNSQNESPLELTPAQVAYLADKLYKDIQDKLAQIAENGQVPMSPEQDALAIKMALLVSLTEKIVAHQQNGQNSEAGGQAENIQIKWQDLEPILYYEESEGGNISKVVRPVIGTQHSEEEQSEQPKVQPVLDVSRTIVYKNVKKLPEGIIAGGLQNDAELFTKAVGEASEKPVAIQSEQSEQAETNGSPEAHDLHDLNEAINSLAQELDKEPGGPTVHQLHQVEQAWQKLRQNTEEAEQQEQSDTGFLGKLRKFGKGLAKYVLGYGLEGKSKLWHGVARTVAIVGLSVVVPGLGVALGLGLAGAAGVAEVMYQTNKYQQARKSILEKLAGVEGIEEFERQTSWRRRIYTVFGSIALGIGAGIGMGLTAPFGIIGPLAIALGGLATHILFIKKTYEKDLRRSIESLKLEATEQLANAVESTKEIYKRAFNIQGLFWRPAKEENGHISLLSHEQVADATHVVVKPNMKAPLLSTLQIISLAKEKLGLTDEQGQKLEQLISQIQNGDEQLVIEKDLILAVFGSGEGAFNIIDNLYALTKAEDVDTRKLALNILDSMRAVFSGAEVINSAYNISDAAKLNGISYKVAIEDKGKLQRFINYFQELYPDINIDEFVKITEEEQAEGVFKVEINLHSIVKHIAENWYEIPDQKLMPLTEMLYSLGDVAIISAFKLKDDKPEIAEKIQNNFVFADKYSTRTNEVLTSARNLDLQKYKEIEPLLDELVNSSLTFFNAIYGLTSLTTKVGFRSVNPHISEWFHHSSASGVEHAQNLADAFKPENNPQLQDLGQHLHNAGLGNINNMQLDVVTHDQAGNLVHHHLNSITDLTKLDSLSPDTLHNADVVARFSDGTTAKLVVDGSGKVLAMPVQQGVLTEALAKFDAMQLGLNVHDLTASTISDHLQGLNLPSGVDASTINHMIQQHIQAGHVAFVDNNGHLLDFSVKNGHLVYSDHGNIHDLVQKALENIHGSGTDQVVTTGAEKHISLNELLSKGSETGLKGHVFYPNNNAVHLHPETYGQHAVFAVLHKNFGNMPTDVQNAIVKGLAIDQGWAGPHQQDRALFVLSQKIVDALQAHGNNASLDQVAHDVFNSSPSIHNAFVAQYGQDHAFEMFKNHVIGQALGGVSNVPTHTEAVTSGMQSSVELSPDIVKNHLNSVFENALGSAGKVSTYNVHNPNNVINLFTQGANLENAGGAPYLMGNEEAIKEVTEASGVLNNFLHNVAPVGRAVFFGAAAGAGLYGFSEFGHWVFGKENANSSRSNRESLTVNNPQAELAGITAPEGLSDEEKEIFEAFKTGLENLSWYKLPNGSLGVYGKQVLRLYAEGSLKGARGVLAWVRAGTAGSGTAGAGAQAQQQAQNQQLVYGKDLMPVIIVQSKDGNRVVVPIDFNAVQEQYNGNLQKYLEAQIEQGNVISMSSTDVLFSGQNGVNEEITMIFNSVGKRRLKIAGRVEHKEFVIRGADDLQEFLRSFVTDIIPMPKGADLEIKGKTINILKKREIEEKRKIRQGVMRLMPKMLAYDLERFGEIQDAKEFVAELEDIKRKLTNVYKEKMTDSLSSEYWNDGDSISLFHTPASGPHPGFVRFIETDKIPEQWQRIQGVFEKGDAPYGSKVVSIYLPNNPNVSLADIKNRPVKCIQVVAIKVPWPDNKGFNFVILDAVRGNVTINQDPNNIHKAKIIFKALEVNSPFKHTPALRIDRKGKLMLAPVWRPMYGQSDTSLDMQRKRIFGNGNTGRLTWKAFYEILKTLLPPVDNREILFADDRIIEVTKDSTTATPENPTLALNESKPLPKPNPEDIKVLEQTFESILGEAEAKLITQSMPRNLLTAFILSLQIEGVQLQQEGEEGAVKLVIPRNKLGEVKAKLVQQTKLGSNMWYYRLALNMFYTALESAGDGDVIIPGLIQEQLANVAGLEPTGSSLQDIEEKLKQENITSMEQFKETDFYRDVIKSRLLKFLKSRAGLDGIIIDDTVRDGELDVIFTQAGLKLVGKQNGSPFKAKVGQRDYKISVIELNLKTGKIVLEAPVWSGEQVSNKNIEAKTNEIVSKLADIIASASDSLPAELVTEVKNTIQDSKPIRIKIEPAKDSQYKITVQRRKRKSDGKLGGWSKLGKPVLVY